MSSEWNPYGREYSRPEIAAGKRVGLVRSEKTFDPYPEIKRTLRGPMIFAGGPHFPEHARQMARDWAIVADALEREWKKTLPAQEDD